MIGFDEQGHPVDEDNVEALQTALGVALPKQYLDFVRRHDGAKPEYSNRLDVPPSNSVRVSRFMKVAEIEEFLGLLEAELGSDYIPIAEASCGNLLLLGTRGENAGRVFFWDHEFEGLDALTLLAPSFLEFLESIQRDA